MLPCSAWRKEGVGGLPDNFVSGGISHVAMQLDVQRESAHAEGTNTPPSRSRSDLYRLFVCVSVFVSPASPQY